MTFKILNDSNLGKELIKLRQLGLEYEKEARIWLIHNFTRQTRYCSPNDSAWGGIGAIEFSVRPDGFKSVGDSKSNLYAPKKANQRVISQWAELPMVSKDTVKLLLNYGSYSGTIGGRTVRNSFPAIIYTHDYILIECSLVAKAYKPVEGMIEIVRSEYQILFEARNSKSIPA